MKNTLQYFAALALFAWVSPTPHAQSSTRIKLMAGFPAGGSTDAVARLLAEKL